MADINELDEVFLRDYARVKNGDLDYPTEKLTKFEIEVLKMFGTIYENSCSTWADISYENLTKMDGHISFALPSIKRILDGCKKGGSVDPKKVNPFINDIKYFTDRQKNTGAKVFRVVRDQKDSVVSNLTVSQVPDLKDYFYSRDDFMLLSPTLKRMRDTIKTEKANREKFLTSKLSKDTNDFIFMKQKMQKLLDNNEYHSEDEALLKYYTFEGDKFLNGNARNKYVLVGDPKNKNLHILPRKLFLQTVLDFKKMLDLFSKREHLIKEAKVVYRGDSLLCFLKRMLKSEKWPPELTPDPKTNKIVLNDETAEIAKKFLKGKIASDAAILSTSTDETVGDQYSIDHDDGTGIKMTIDLSADSDAIDISKISQFEAEAEIILKPRTKLKIDDISYRQARFATGGILDIKLTAIK